jgi:ribonucleotide monophosphatase NagD (HAD superfamily)
VQDLLQWFLKKWEVKLYILENLIQKFIINQLIIKIKKFLSIGDNLNTDIKGANLLNFDSLIISNGIHKNEIKEKGIEKTSKSYEAICNYIQSELKW